MKRRIPVLVAAAVIFICCSKSLDVELEGLNVVLDNEFSLPFRPEAAAPYHYGILLYDQDSGHLAHEDFCDAGGGLISGHAGTFTAVAYDLDNTVLRFDGKETLEGFRAYSDEETASVKNGFHACQRALSAQVGQDGLNLVSVKGKAGYEEGPVIREPDELFAGIAPYVDIPAKSKNRDAFSFKVATRFALQQGRIGIRGIRNTHFISSIQIFLTNLARGRYIGTNMPEESPATLAFCLGNISEEGAQGSFNYFGLLSDASLPNTVYILVSDLSGGTYLFVADVTQLLRGSADLQIQLDFEMPSPETGSAGFSPVINDWGTVWYDIPIG